MTAKISKARIADMHAYHQVTVAKGEWCSEVTITGLTYSQWTRLVDAISSRPQVLHYTSHGTGCIYLTTTGAAESVAKAVKRMGGSAEILRGKATFACRGYYDDQGLDFVKAD